VEAELATQPRFVVVVTVVIVGLSVYGAVILSPNVALEDKLATALDEAADFGEIGRCSRSNRPPVGAKRRWDYSFLVQWPI
jgi:hypothetical protein